MPVDENFYLQRDRAESFGVVAEDYDRFRPSYPVELIDDLAALAPRAVLDVGCGTGKAGRLLQARGLPVLGVEVDPKMADVARGHGLDVEVSGFEDWTDRGRCFDLIISAQAWHWVEPVRAVPKARGLLEPDGVIALFWNDDELDAPEYELAEQVYRRLEPRMWEAGTRASAHDLDGYVGDFKQYGGFTDVRTRRYAWQRSETAGEWVARAATHSDHQLLGAQRLAALGAALLDAFGGPDVPLRSTGGTSMVDARAGS